MTASYSLMITCPDCGEIHQLPTLVSLTDGPDDEAEKLTKVFGDRLLPPEVQAAMRQTVRCSVSRTDVMQHDPNQVWVVR